MQEIMKQVPVEQIPENELLLYMPPTDYMLEAFQKLWRWQKVAHDFLTNPDNNMMRRMVQITRQGETAYRDMLEEIQDRYQEKEQMIIYHWMTKVPLEPGETRVSRMNYARLSARETLIPEIIQELGG